jgi:hypothetical protein
LISGENCIAIESDSYFEQTINFGAGQYVFSMYYISRYGTESNPIVISIGGLVNRSCSPLCVCTIVGRGRYSY